MKSFLEMYNLKNLTSHQPFSGIYLRLCSTIRMDVNQEKVYITDAAQLKKQGLPTLVVKGLQGMALR